MLPHHLECNIKCKKCPQVGRLEEPCYFSHLLDVIRSPLGRPLLEQVAAQADKLAALLTAHEPQHPAAALPEGAGARQRPALTLHSARGNPYFWGTRMQTLSALLHAS